MLSSQNIKKFALDHGAGLCRIADLNRLNGIFTEPADLLARFSAAISIAVRLDGSIISDIKELPAPEYEAHYKTINAQLDNTAKTVAEHIKHHGGNALALPASQILNHEVYTSALSHKAVAVAAGLGWQGKSLLTITPEHGPRVRLVTVLTDLDLKMDYPLENRCGKCSKCSDACPAQAIKNVTTDSHYAYRNVALHFDRCRAHVENILRTMPQVNSLICGVCIRACPWGKTNT